MLGFNYKPLAAEPGAIRILRLKPTSNPDEPIEIELHHDFYTSCEYTAISYVWGDPVHTHYVRIDGCDFGVGHNLFKVLQSLRSHAGSRAFWIDAICINQSDIPERNAQVQDMAAIYRNAVEVVGCLGDKTPNFALGFELLKELLDGEDVDAGVYETFDSHAERWDALTFLIHRPYWNRLWIVQEIAINPNVYLWFGNDANAAVAANHLSKWYSIDRDVFSTWRRLNPGVPGESFRMRRFGVMSDSLINMLHLPLLYPLTVDEFQPLLQSLLSGGPLATNPLDAVYGVLGLFDTPVLTVDYSLSPRDLYLRVIELVQHRTGQLEFLSWAWGGYYQDPDYAPMLNAFNIPRWGIDFSFRTRNIRPNPLTRSSGPQRLFVDIYNYKASGDRKQCVQFDKDAGSMSAKGARIARIAAIGSVAEWKLDTTIWPQDWNGIVGLPGARSPAKHPDTRAHDPYLRAWALSSDPPMTDLLTVWWRILLADTLSGFLQIDVEGDERSVPPIPPVTVSDVEILCRHLTVLGTCPWYTGRRLIKTETGLLGLGPPDAQVGDWVCVLHGGDVLYVLRKNLPAEKWSFIGECYLHGMMHGEALAEDAPPYDFVIEG